jgi:hypothetical protein
LYVGIKNQTTNEYFFFIYLAFSYGDNGTFSPPMDVNNQTQNGIQHTSGNSNYSSGSGGESPTSLSPGKINIKNKKDLFYSKLNCSANVIRPI